MIYSADKNAAAIADQIIRIDAIETQLQQCDEKFATLTELCMNLLQVVSSKKREQLEEAIENLLEVQA